MNKELPPIPVEVQQIILDNVYNGFFDCKAYHHGSCEAYAFQKFLKVFRVALKIYMPIHLIPILLYKRKNLKQQPVETLSRASLHLGKSLCFVSMMSGLMIYLLCLAKNRRHRMDGFGPLLSGLIGAIPLLMEGKGRRNEIVLYVLPRGLEVLINVMLKHKQMVKIPHFDLILFSGIMAILHYYYQQDPKAVKPTVSKILYKFWGTN